MALKIQRLPRGLNDLLSIFGGQTPQNLEETVRGSLELLQFYGLQQRQLLALNNAALAEGGNVQVTAAQWFVLFGATVTVVKTATATALRGAIFVNRSGSGAANSNLPVSAQEGGPFGATETGAVHMPWQPSFPWLCPPGTTIQGFLAILGTDATANVTIQAEVGVLG